MALLETEHLKTAAKGTLAYFGEARSIDYRQLVCPLFIPSNPFYF